MPKQTRPMLPRDNATLRRCPASIALIERVPEDLLEVPLDYIFAQNFRLRCFCSRLRELTNAGRLTRTEAHAVVSFLTHDMSIHREDEGDLLPAALKSARPEDGLEPIIALLSQSCERADARIAAIVRAFVRQRNRPVTKLTHTTSVLVADFATDMQRHLSLMNGIVLVIARKRLSLQDLAAISRCMKLRRGAIL